MKYKISEYAKLKGVQYRTVWNWIKKGTVQIERTETGRVLVIVEEPVKPTKELSNALSVACLNQKQEH